MKIQRIKTILAQVCIGALLLPLFSCEDDLPVYKDVDRVYFNYVLDDVPGNSRVISFGYDTPMREDSVTKIKVKLLGRVSDQKRYITAEVIGAESNATEGENLLFIRDSSYIPAGKSDGWLWVKLLNTDTLLTTTMLARIRLTPNEYFHTDYNYYKKASSGAAYQALEYILHFDAKSEKPNLWDALSNYFNAWSRPKEQAICAALGVTREEYFTYDPAVETAAQAAAKRVSDGQAFYAVAGVVNRWLYAYRNGTTYLDGTVKVSGEPLRDGDGGKIGNPITYYFGGMGIQSGMNN